MKIKVISIKTLLERVGFCWSLLDCWTVGQGFSIWEMEKNIFFFQN